MKISNWNIKLGELEAKATYDSIMNRQLSEGENVKLFEKRMAEALNVKYAIATPNGSSALLLANMGIGIKPGDEVIVPDLTFIATAHAPKLLGAKVIVADTMADTPLIDIDSVLNLITDKTKAIIPVHLNGRRACTKQLREVLKDKGIYIIDDSCQALFSGVDGDYAGCDADISCYSFAVTKIMTTGQGGLVTTNNEELYNKMKQLKTQGLKSVFECDYYEMAGFNLKFTDILASIGLIQLDKIELKKQKLRENYELYCEGLKSIESIKMIPTNPRDMVWVPDILCEDSKSIRKILEDNNIQVRPSGSCLHRASYFVSSSNYTNSEKFENQLLYLPSGTDQPKENILEVIDVLNKNLK